MSSTAGYKRETRYMRETHPDLAANMSPCNYPLTPDNTRAGTNTPITWICNTGKSCLHTWVTSGGKRVLGAGCPACANQVVNNMDGRNSMSKTHPHLAADWDWERNGSKTPDSTIAGTNVPIFWICNTGKACLHRWVTKGSNRACMDQGCPSCAGRSVNSFDARNSLLYSYPDLALEFDIVRNCPATAKNILPGSHFKYWWRCSLCSYSWEASASNRSLNNSGCIRCNRTYTASEHISNTYLKMFLEEVYTVDIRPETSTVFNPEGRDFQIDARVYQNDTLAVAYLYDGAGGHSDSAESIGTDIKRRETLCRHIPIVIAHRHGMRNLSSLPSNYFEVATAKRSSILCGVKKAVGLLTTRFKEINHELALAEATKTWKSLPKANTLRMRAAVIKELKAIALESDAIRAPDDSASASLFL